MRADDKPSFAKMALEPGVVTRAAKVALIVGTIIGAINYGDRAFAGDLVLRDVIKIALTYVVPYCVSTWSAVQAIRALQARTS